MPCGSPVLFRGLDSLCLASTGLDVGLPRPSSSSKAPEVTVEVGGGKETRFPDLLDPEAAGAGVEDLGPPPDGDRDLGRALDLDLDLCLLVFEAWGFGFCPWWR